MADVIGVIGDIGGSLLGTIDRLIPQPPAALVSACAKVPAILNGPGSFINDLVPVGAIVAGLIALGLVITAVVAIRVARIGVSISTGGGGA